MRTYKFWRTYKRSYEFGSTYKRSYVRFFAPGPYMSGSYGSKVTPLGSLDAEKIAKAVLLYLSSIPSIPLCKVILHRCWSLIWVPECSCCSLVAFWVRGMGEYMWCTAPSESIKGAGARVVLSSPGAVVRYTRVHAAWTGAGW